MMFQNLKSKNFIELWVLLAFDNLGFDGLMMTGTEKDVNHWVRLSTHHVRLLKIHALDDCHNQGLSSLVILYLVVHRG